MHQRRMDEETPDQASSLVPGRNADVDDHHDNNIISDAAAPVETSLTGSSSRSWTQSINNYIQSKDFVEFLFGLFLLIAGVIFEGADIQPHDRPIPAIQLESTGEYVVNQVYNEEFLTETISDFELVLYSLLLPYLLLAGLIIATGVRELHNLTVVYLTAGGIGLICTEMIKLYCGYLRPIFLSSCSPDADYEQCSNDEYDYRLSFPSGHASLSVGGILIACYYLERTFGVSSILGFHVDQESGTVGLKYTSPPRFRKIVSVICYAPMLLAIYISISRIRDNKHFPADVVGGALLGGSIATFVYNIWFPTLPSIRNFDER